MRSTLCCCLALSLAAQASSQKGWVTSRVEAAGGEIQLAYQPVPLPNKFLEDHQRKGTVWSIGAQEAATLTTTVALRVGKKLLPPGTHRLSTWFRKPGDWQLLVFEGPKNFKRGTPFRTLPLALRKLPRSKSEMLRGEVVASRGAVRLQFFAGATRLRVTLEPIAVQTHEGTLAGLPAVYEFYSYPADYRVQGRLRDLELIQFGRVRTTGKFGAVYDISAKSDGNGIFVICHSETLKRNRDLLARRSKALAKNPGDAGLKAEVQALQSAVAAQSDLQSNVMVPGEVEKVSTRAAQLGVQPALESDGTAFELSFGLRKAKFTLNPSQFKKLKWR